MLRRRPNAGALIRRLMLDRIDKKGAVTIRHKGWRVEAEDADLEVGHQQHDSDVSRHHTAQLAFRNANNDPLIVGAPVLLSERHAKVRREGYRR